MWLAICGQHVSDKAKIASRMLLFWQLTRLSEMCCSHEPRSCTLGNGIQHGKQTLGILDAIREEQRILCN